MTPGAGVILLGSRESAEAYPRGQLLYELTAAEEDFAPHHSSARFTEAESLERRKQYDQAIPILSTACDIDRSGGNAEALYAPPADPSRKASAGANGAVAKKQLDEAPSTRFQRLAREPSSRITPRHASVGSAGAIRDRARTEARSSVPTRHWSSIAGSSAADGVWTRLSTAIVPSRSPAGFHRTGTHAGYARKKSRSWRSARR
jgi:hypothetical protein